MSKFDLTLKRMLDLVLATILFVCILPLLLLIWIAIRLTSGGPAVLAQERIGYKGRAFKMYKFRTMFPNVDDTLHREYVRKWINNHAHSSENGQNVFKISEDKRVTPIGRFLRRYSFDELPQVMNVLKLQMSLVGPRPALPYEVENYKDWHWKRFETPPGITGAWQVNGRNHVSFDDMVSLDIRYIRNWSIQSDFIVLAKTVPVVLKGTGK
jgi:lipopolysaccharide/colanic/teichoic acid biosynthesis glycosyltransferase